MNCHFSNRDIVGKVCFWGGCVVDVGWSVAVSGLGWVSAVQGILPVAESKQRWGNYVFSVRLLCVQEIQKVAFILQLGTNVALFRVS